MSLLSGSEIGCWICTRRHSAHQRKWSFNLQYDWSKMPRNRGIPDQYQLVARTVSLTIERLTEIPGATAAKGPDTQVHNSRTIQPAPTPMRTSESQEIAARRSRAKSLRKQYPDMKNIPEEITKQQKKRLIKQYNDQTSTTKANNVGGSAGVQVSRNTNPAQLSAEEAIHRKQSERAARLKREHPEIARLIPSKIGKKASKSIIDKQGASTSTGPLVSRASGQARATLPRRPASPAHTQGTYPTRQATALHGLPNGISRDSNALQSVPNGWSGNTSARNPKWTNKMAPLSDERRAEVARNLSGLSQDDPINID